MINHHDHAEQHSSSVYPPLQALARLLQSGGPEHGAPVDPGHDTGSDLGHLPLGGESTQPGGDPIPPLQSQLDWAVSVAAKETYSGTSNVNGLWSVNGAGYMRSSANALYADPGTLPNPDIGQVVREAWLVLRSQGDIYITVDYNIGNGILALINLTNPVTLQSFAPPIDWTRISRQEWLDSNSRGLGYFYDDNIPPSFSTTERQGVQVRLPAGGLYLLIGATGVKPWYAPGPDPQLWTRFETPFTSTGTVTAEQNPVVVSAGTLMPGTYSNQFLGNPFVEPGPQLGGVVQANSSTVTVQLTGFLQNIGAGNFSAVRGANGLIAVTFNGTVSSAAGRATANLTLPVQYQRLDPNQAL